MLQETDDVATPSVAANPRADQAKEVSIAGSSAAVIDFFDARDQKPAPRNASSREAERLRKIVYLTRRRERGSRLIDPFEDSLCLLILAAVMGSLLIAFLGP